MLPYTEWGKAFSNQVYSDYIRTTYSVIVKGYNYDELYGYAEALRERLIVSGKGRIKEVFLLGANSEAIFSEVGAGKYTRDRPRDG